MIYYVYKRNTYVLRSIEEWRNEMANLITRVQDSEKIAFKNLCEKSGLSVSKALNLYVQKSLQDKKLPFEMRIVDTTKEDMFYSKENVDWIKESLEQSKKGQVVEKTIEELERFANE